MIRAGFKQDASRSSPSVYISLSLVCIVLVIHAYYVTAYSKAPKHTYPFNVHVPLTSQLLTNSTPNLPPLFIYRRTKKSGSSAMLDALIRALKPYGYVPLYHEGSAIKAAVRAEGLNPFPRRLLVAEHNQVTRDDDPLRRAVIADTVRDGYEQITSFCRYQRHVKTCDEALVKCLESDVAKSQNRYRWAGREREDAATYIDLPLSTAHPALSTTVFRRFFPNATLDIYTWNSVNSRCPELPMLREEYLRLYGQLDRQIELLRKRMLVLAGYPTKSNTDESDEISLEEMLSAAEAREREKYDIVDHGPQKQRFSESHNELRYSVMLWSRDGKNKSLVLTQRWE